MKINIPALSSDIWSDSRPFSYDVYGKGPYGRYGRVGEKKTDKIRAYNDKHISKEKRHKQQIRKRLRRKINDMKIADEIGVRDINKEIH